jgi:hypothetical protein
MVHQQPRRDFNFVGHGNFSCSELGEALPNCILHHHHAVMPFEISVYLLLPLPYWIEGTEIFVELYV